MDGAVAFAETQTASWRCTVLKDYLFWIALTLFGSGTIVIFEDHVLWGSIMIFVGVIGMAYCLREHWKDRVHGKVRFLLSATLLLLTWAAVGYDYYDRHRPIGLWGTFDLEKWNRYQKKEVAHKTFTNENVVLDGKSFLDCTFENATLTYNGTAPFNFEGNAAKGSVVIHSDNPALMGFLLFAQQVGELKNTEIHSTDSGKIYKPPPR
jgi:hypothetical protein